MKITIFDDYEEKGQYFIDSEGMIWLHGTLLANRLGFANPSEAITKHTDNDERRKEEINGRMTWFVSEPGIWGMILVAKTPEATEFKRKLKHDILPKLRSSGYYIDTNATTEQLEAAKAEIDQLKQSNFQMLQYIDGELGKAKDRAVTEVKAYYTVDKDAPTGNPICHELWKAANYDEKEAELIRTQEELGETKRKLNTKQLMPTDIKRFLNELADNIDSCPNSIAKRKIMGYIEQSR